MSGLFKRVISATLVVALVLCCLSSLAALASTPMYFLDVYTEGGGHVVRERAMYSAGETVYMRAVPDEGFSFFCWASEDVVLQNASSDYIGFIMPANNVQITAVFAITQDAVKNTVNVTFDTMGGSAFGGVDVTVGECVAKPENIPTKEGYVFDGWYADALGTLPFDFSMPVTSATIIYAKWAEPVVEVVPDNAFSDVKPGDWFYAHVMSLAEKNVISGMGTDASGNPYFAPLANITRAQFVTILLNLTGENLYKDFVISAVFDDVKEDAWYADAVAWAYSTGISGGTGNSKFSPDSYITRQDMAVMISNYALKVAKKTLPDSVEKVEFSDSEQIAQYAKASVETMQRAGIISGRSNNHGAKFFAPRDFATRAETSKMIDVLLTEI